MFSNTLSIRSIVRVNYLMKKISQVFLTCTCTSKWASEEIFSGGQKRYFACQFQVADNAMQIDVRKTLYPFCAIKKMPNVEATVTNRVPSEKICTEQMFVLVSIVLMFSQCFGIVQVRKNEISLPKWSGVWWYLVPSPRGGMHWWVKLSPNKHLSPPISSFKYHPAHT